MLIRSKHILLITSVLLVLSLFGCSGQKANVNEQEATKTIQKNDNHELIKLGNQIIVSVSISKIGKNMRDIMEPHISYNKNSTQEFKTFVNAIRNAEKIKGVVDMQTPDYLLTFAFVDGTTSKYALSLGPDAGSIVNQEDTSTVSILQSTIIEDLHKYVYE